jgi:hypothetical protein
MGRPVPRPVVLPGVVSTPAEAVFYFVAYVTFSYTIFRLIDIPNKIFNCFGWPDLAYEPCRLELALPVFSTEGIF